MAQDVKIDIKFKLLEDVNKNVKRMSDNIRSLGNLNLGKLTSNFASLKSNTIALNQGLELVGRSFNFLNRTFGGAVRGFAEFEAAVIEVSTLLPKSQQNVKALMGELSGLSVQFGTSNVTQAKALYTTISSGFADAADASKLLRQANKLALAGVTDTQTAVGGLTAVLKAYNLSTDESARISDVLFATMKNARTTIGELSSNISKVTGVGANLGISFEQLSAALGTLTLDGTDTATAAVQLRQILVSVLNPTKEASDAAYDLGLDFNRAALESQGFAKFLNNVKNSLKGNKDAAGKLFGNVRALQGIIKITANDTKLFNQLLNDNVKAMGDTDRAAKIVKESLDFKLKVINAQFTEFSNILVQLTAPALKTVSDELLKFARILKEEFVEDPTANLSEQGKKLTETLKKSQIDLQELINKRNNSFANLTGRIFPSINKGLDDQIAKQREIVTGLSMQLAAEIKSGQAVDDKRKKINQTTEAIQEATQASKDGAEAIIFGIKFDTIQASLLDFLGNIREAFQKIPKDQSFLNSLKAAAESFGQVLSDALSGIGEFLKTKKGAEFAKGAVGTISSGGEAVKKQVSGALMSSGNPYAAAAGAVIEIFGKTKEEFTKWIKGLFKTFIDLPRQIATNIPIFIDEFVRAIPGLLTAFNDFAPIVIDGLVSLLEDPTFIDAMTNALITGTLGALIFTISSPFLLRRLTITLIKALVNAVPMFINSLIEGIQKELEGVFDSFASGIQGFVDAIGVFSGIIDSVKGIAGGVTGGAGDFFSGIGDVFGFADGGIIPAPAGQALPIIAHGGENVIDRSTNKRLENMLSAFESGALGGGPSTLVVKTVVGEKELAETMFKLNKRGYRVA